MKMDDIFDHALSLFTLAILIALAVLVGEAFQNAGINMNLLFGAVNLVIIGAVTISTIFGIILLLKLFNSQSLLIRDNNEGI